MIEEEEKFKKRRDMEDDGNTWKETRELEIMEKMRRRPSGREKLGIRLISASYSRQLDELGN